MASLGFWLDVITTSLPMSTCLVWASYNATVRSNAKWKNSTSMQLGDQQTKVWTTNFPISSNPPSAFLSHSHHSIQVLRVSTFLISCMSTTSPHPSLFPRYTLSLPIYHFPIISPPHYKNPDPQFTYQSALPHPVTSIYWLFSLFVLIADLDLQSQSSFCHHRCCIDSVFSHLFFAPNFSIYSLSCLVVTAIDSTALMQDEIILSGEPHLQRQKYRELQETKLNLTWTSQPLTWARTPGWSWIDCAAGACGTTGIAFSTRTEKPECFADACSPVKKRGNF